MFLLKRKQAEFNAEVEAHIELEAERLRELGLSDEEAHAAARRAFGNVTQAQERFYEAGRWLWWDHLRHDIRYALRMLRKSPGFAAIAVLTVALGVGANTAIYSVVDATLLHPLPYAQPEQLVKIEDDLPGVGAQDVGMSTPEWHDLERSGVFKYISPAWYDDNNLTGSAHPLRVHLMIVAPNYFGLLGVQPQLGSAFNPEDPTPGFNGQCLISDGLWKRLFAGDPRILGRSVRLDNDSYRIIGVMPPGFRHPGRTIEERNVEVWVAGGFAATPFADPRLRTSHFPGAVARLQPGLTIAAAQSKVDALVAALQKQFPADYPAQSAWRVRLVPLRESVAGNVRQSLFFLFGAVGLVLLIGCVNVANLLLARACARGRETALRRALGAARGRLTRQLLTESLLLSLLGGIAGVAILFFAQGFLLRLVPDSLPRLNDISMSWSVLLFALGACVVAGALFGLAPAWHAGRLDLIHMLKQEGRGSTGSGEQARARRVLVVTEFALCLMLMISASLLLRSFWRLLNVQLGFDPRSVMMVRTRLPYPNDPKTDIYGTLSAQVAFFREVLRRGKTLPGVEEIALGDSSSVPLDHHHRDQTLFPLIVEGRGTRGNQTPVVNGSVVTPEYFHLMGMTLLRGRLFSDHDVEEAPEVAVINEAMARTYWPNEDPLGRHLKLSPSAACWTTVIGVVANARTESLEDSEIPQMYASLYQRKQKHLAIFLRGKLDIAAVPDEIREQVQSVNSEIPVYGAEALTEVVSSSLSVRRFSMECVGLFALIALLLAGLGIYGVISYLVSERTHEIGIRLALGAQRSDVMRIVIGQGLGLAIAGTAVGLVGALIMSRLMAGLLFGVGSTDPLTFAGVALLLIGVALLACYIPARRATRVDPLVALRYE